MYGLTPCSPEPGLFFEDTGDRASTSTANRLPVVDIQVPGRKRVPTASDQGFATLVTVGTRTLEIMDITGIDITQPVLQCNPVEVTRGC